MYKITTYIKENEQLISQYISQCEYLWDDHMFYTRNAIISIPNKLSDTDAVVSRLLANQEQLGTIISPYYHETDVSSLVDLLKEHIRLVGNIALNSSTDTTDYTSLLYQNGINITNLMYNMNPYYWARGTTWPLWESHLNYVTEQITTRQNSMWEDDLVACDFNHSIMMDFARVYARGTVYKCLEMFSEPLLR